MPRKALEARLVAEARGEGLKYGLVIRRFDDAAITGAPEFTRRELVQMLQVDRSRRCRRRRSLAYKVYPGGKEELVRGVQLGEIPIRVWKDVARHEHRAARSTTSWPRTRTSSRCASRAAPTTASCRRAASRAAIITPDLLVKELDVTGSTAGQRQLPQVPKPK